MGITSSRVLPEQVSEIEQHMSLLSPRYVSALQSGALRDDSPIVGRMANLRRDVETLRIEVDKNRGHPLRGMANRAQLRDLKFAVCDEIETLSKALVMSTAVLVSAQSTQNARIARDRREKFVTKSRQWMTAEM